MTLASMNEELDIDAESLADEIASYLAVVDAFRAADCEPTWRPEPSAFAVARRSASVPRHVEKSTH